MCISRRHCDIVKRIPDDTCITFMDPSLGHYHAVTTYREYHNYAEVRVPNIQVS